MNNYVLTTGNVASTFVYLGATRPSTAIDGIPLGLTASGELVVKVADVGAGGDSPVDIVTVNAVASSTTNIPVGATSVGVLLQTGTGTLNGVSMVVGIPYNFVGPIKTITPVVLGSTSTAIINYTV